MGHTPGPWVVAKAVNGNWIEYGSEGQSIARTFYSHTGYKQEDANALLIAAAPDLLAALEALQSEFFPLIRPADYPEIKDARAAIAKAKGEA
jgi:hypothetical protein